MWRPYFCLRLRSKLKVEARGPDLLAALSPSISVAGCSNDKAVTFAFSAQFCIRCDSSVLEPWPLFAFMITAREVLQGILGC